MELEDSDHECRRIDVALPGVREFQIAFEQAVPDLPAMELSALVAAGAPWSQMVELVEKRAPYGFLVYYRSDVHRLLKAAGDAADCILYLMGNHTIAERMFRHDPRVMLYAPMQAVMWEDQAGKAWFTVDLPSAQLASFDVPEIAAVGRELDRKLAALLDALNLEVPTVLATTDTRVLPRHNRLDGSVPPLRSRPGEFDP